MSERGMLIGDQPTTLLNSGSEP